MWTFRDIPVGQHQDPSQSDSLIVPDVMQHVFIGQSLIAKRPDPSFPCEGSGKETNCLPDDQRNIVSPMSVRKWYMVANQ